MVPPLLRANVEAVLHTSAAMRILVLACYRQLAKGRATEKRTLSIGQGLRVSLRVHTLIVSMRSG